MKLDRIKDLDLRRGAIRIDSLDAFEALYGELWLPWSEIEWNFKRAPSMPERN